MLSLRKLSSWSMSVRTHQSLRAIPLSIVIFIFWVWFVGRGTHKYPVVCREAILINALGSNYSEILGVLFFFFNSKSILNLILYFPNLVFLISYTVKSMRTPLFWSCRFWCLRCLFGTGNHTCYFKVP